MRPPFPGMDPWLEQPAIWPDVHNSLIAGIRDELAPRLAPKYYVSLEERTYLLAPEEEEILSRPDLAVVETRPGTPEGRARAARGALGDGQSVEVEVAQQLTEWFLNVRLAGRNRLVTVIEILSPANKRTRTGRKHYLRKRRRVLDSRTSLVEIDLLRDGRPMPLRQQLPANDYRILVARGRERPRARLFAWDVEEPIPDFPIPLLPGDEEPRLDLGPILHALYDRARFDLRLDYRKPPDPPLSPDSAAWARDILGAAG